MSPTLTKPTIILLFSLTLVACSEKNGSTLFTELDTNATNVSFNNELADSPDFNVMKYGYFYNGGGVAAADFNNDGFTDLYFTGNIVPDRLYIHKGGGEIQFEDVTAKAGLGRSQGWKTGVSVVDINDDGWMDMYVCRSAAETPSMRSNLLYINNGDLTFTESAEKYGLADRGYSTQAVFFDYDRDLDLDCFILNHSVQRYAGFNHQLAAFKNREDQNYGSRLMRNDNGVFSDVSKAAGLVSNVLSFGLGVIVSDLNGDNWPDIYVSNDYNEEDYMYINQQNGSFAEHIRDACAYTSLFSMGSDAADINNDGRIDLVTLDMLPEGNERIKMTSGDDNYEKYLNLVQSGFHRQYMRNMLQLNLGNQTDITTAEGKAVPLFQEIGQISGISNTDWSWSALFADLDLDGQKDLFVTNGYEKDYTNMDFLNYTVSLQTRIQSNGEILDELAVIEKMPSIRERNYIFQNQGHARFENKAVEWGLDKVGVSSGAACADLDNDGDLDLIINNLNAPASIYLNNRNPNNAFSVQVELRAKPYSLLPGAKVEVFSGSTRQIQEYMPVRGFQSSAAGPLVFGLGTVQKIDSICVTWADGTKQTQKGPISAGKIQIERKNPTIENKRYTEQQGWTVTPAPYTHASPDVNDFKIQPLLPYMPSFQGPASAVSTDGRWMYVTGSRLKAGTLFELIAGEMVPRLSSVVGNVSAADESDAVFADIDKDGDEDLVIVYADYQGSAGPEALKPAVFLNKAGKFAKSSSSMTDVPSVCAGTVVAYDYNSDGNVDLFVGSRVLPGQFPESGPSLLLTNNGKGSFSLAQPSHQFPAGMVTDAVVADLDGDKKVELIVAREFGTVAFLHFTEGKPLNESFTDITPTGCWQTIKVADVNGDSQLDILAGNMGTNNQLHAVSDEGLQLYSGTFFGIAKAIPVLAVKENGVWYPFAARDELLAQMPVLKKTYGEYALYSKATMEDIFGGELDKAMKLTAQTLETGLWLQTNGTFNHNQGAFPLEAQYTPVYAIAVADVNGDSVQDIVLGGNNLKTRVRIGDMNSSFGTILTGKNGGSFTYGGEIGIKGQIRSLALIKKGKNPTVFAGIQDKTAKIIQWK